MDLEFRIKLTNELPEQFIINTLKEAIKTHESIKTEKSRNHLLEACSTFLIKDIVKKDGVKKTIEQMNQVNNINNFFQNSSN